MTESSQAALREQSRPVANITRLPRTEGFSAGKYSVRLATTVGDVAAAQALRYQTLYVEANGKPRPEWQQARREFDHWDEVAYHVIVTDKNLPEGEDVVGCLRLVSNRELREGEGFYTEEAFDISALRGHYGKILELSRFCIADSGRSGSILLLIWRFTMQLIVDNGYDLMIGCASFKGTDLEQHKSILSYLYDNNLAPAHLQPKALHGNTFKIADIHERNPEWDNAKQAVPTLLRGYLKIGAKISDTAVIDEVFNTTFVTIYVDAEQMVTGNHTLTSGTDHGKAKAKAERAAKVNNDA